jgi:hypothetical protein
VALLSKFRTKRGLQGRSVPCPFPRGVRANCPARSDSLCRVSEKSENEEGTRNAAKSAYRVALHTKGCAAVKGKTKGICTNCNREIYFEQYRMNRLTDDPVKNNCSDSKACTLRGEEATLLTREEVGLKNLMKKYGEIAGLHEQQRHFRALTYSITTHTLDKWKVPAARPAVLPFPV